MESLIPGNVQGTTKKAIFKGDATIEHHFTANKGILLM